MKISAFSRISRPYEINGLVKNSHTHKTISFLGLNIRNINTICENKKFVKRRTFWKMRIYNARNVLLILKVVVGYLAATHL